MLIIFEKQNEDDEVPTATSVCRGPGRHDCIVSPRNVKRIKIAIACAEINKGSSHNLSRFMRVCVLSHVVHGVSCVNTLSA